MDRYYATTQQLIDAVQVHARRIDKNAGLFGERSDDIIGALRRGDIVHPIWEDFGIGLTTDYRGMPK